MYRLTMGLPLYVENTQIPQYAGGVTQYFVRMFCSVLLKFEKSVWK